MPRFVFLFLFAAATFAQRFEIHPFAGYGTNGKIPADSPAFRQIEATEGTAWGLRAGANIDDEGAIEFAWQRQKMELRGAPGTGGAGRALFAAQTDHLQLNFMYHFVTAEQQFRPFAYAGFGATIYSARNAAYDNEAKPSFALGAGFKYFFSRHAGIRVQARWAPTWLTGHGGGIFCRNGAACAATIQGRFQTQADFTAGPVFRF